MVKPAYGLVESGRLWQLCVEEWLTDYGFVTIPGFPPFFVLPSNGDKPALFIAKVVDDILIAGDIPEIERFSTAIAKRFKICRAIIDRPLIFNGLSIHQDANFDVHVSMDKYLKDIEPIPLTRSRRKEPCQK